MTPRFTVPGGERKSPRRSDQEIRSNRGLESVPDFGVREPGERGLGVSVAAQAVAVASNTGVGGQREVGVHLVPLEAEPAPEVQIPVVGIRKAVNGEHILL